MANISLGFNLSASAVGMSQGINAGVVELQKLGYAAKQTSRDVATLKTIEISRAFIAGITTVARTFQSFTSGALNAIDNTRQLAESLGVTYGELRTLQVAADLSGASSETLAAAFTRAQVTISKAAGGSKEATAALKLLGLSVDELRNQSSTQQFSAIAQAINAIENPAQRAAAAVAIFGRSGAQLLPTFRELPENLRTANTFLAGFQNGVNGINPAAIDAIGDSFSLAGQALSELAGRLLQELQPALTQGAQEFVSFIQSVDVPRAARAVRAALSDIAQVLSQVATFAAPLAQNLLPAIGGYLAFINRQALAAGIRGLASFFSSAASAALGYSAAAGTAATATVTLTAALRSLAISTGVGALVVALGIGAGAFVDWATSGESSAAQVVAATNPATDAARRNADAFAAAAANAAEFGAEAEKALKVPQLTAQDFAENALSQATSAVRQLAEQLGGLERVPANISAAFQQLQQSVRDANDTTFASANALRTVSDDARSLTATIQSLTKAEEDRARAAKDAADLAVRVAQDAQNRTRELASQSLPTSEQNRLKLQEDLLAISREIANAERARSEAVRAGDAAAVKAADERLRLARLASEEARNQDRLRKLEARGIDTNVIRPTRTLADDLRSIKDAFQARELSGDEARLALRNLAQEGIAIRAEILRELSRPSQRALQVSDVRTSEGISQFFAAGRQDPAIEQRREQLKKLDEIRRAIIDAGLRPVDILGA